MKRDLVYFPDNRLTVPCAPVTQFDASLKALADDLYDTMRAAPGVGITAAHIGIPLRVVVLELPEIGGRHDYINPEVLSHSVETTSHTEGSVSMPGATETVTRPASIRLRYQDLDGQVQERAMDGFAAICMQHEIDQLNGIFWLQRLSRLKRERLVKQWKKNR